MTTVVKAINVHKKFNGQEVLKGVDLEVSDGEVLCILGPSGGGKSTLLRCLNHLETLDDGVVWIDGSIIGYELRDGVLRELPPRKVRQQQREIGMVFQHFNLFPHMTALQNVIEGPMTVRKESRASVTARATELLAAVGLGDRGGAYPSQLSGGQKQRVAIARSLAMNPKVMLFDEPTSALDPELVGEVLDVMRKLAASGTTMIVVTHEIAFARDVADRVAIMVDGTIREIGPPSEVLANPQDPRVRSFLTRVLN
ncbi:amino acid ABC transporter ATP-binding protein [Paeniglutamicibacter sp. NPDC012692]|uniref:amino acid ABC transporter ATP-binding protein n=1 Tax=Paeniglutamicibacter sp. NPDC012692 TaxID=3364388 RepID=UPI00369A174B